MAVHNFQTTQWALLLAVSVLFFPEPAVAEELAQTASFHCGERFITVVNYIDGTDLDGYPEGVVVTFRKSDSEIKAAIAAAKEKGNGGRY